MAIYFILFDCKKKNVEKKDIQKDVIKNSLITVTFYFEGKKKKQNSNKLHSFKSSVFLFACSLHVCFVPNVPFTDTNKMKMKNVCIENQNVHVKTKSTFNKKEIIFVSFFVTQCIVLLYERKKKN